VESRDHVLMEQQDGTLLLYVNDAGVQPDPPSTAEPTMVVLHLGCLICISELANNSVKLCLSCVENDRVSE